jgi:cbb3-type cytochrome oxidase subunit 3
MITLINWGTANLLMALVTLCLILIPAIMLYIAFRKHKGANANKEEYEKEHPAV